MSSRNLIVFLILVASSAPVATAAAAGFELTLSSAAGYGVFDDLSTAGLEVDDGFIVEGRAGLTFLGYIGIEGTYGKSTANSGFAPNRDFTLDHIGADVLLNVFPNRIVNPYVLGGWSQLNVDNDVLPGSDVLKLNGWEVGAGVKIRLLRLNGLKVKLRFDARDVFLENDAPLQRAGQTQDHFLFTGGVELGLFEPFLDADGDGVPDDFDHCPGSRPGAEVDALGCEPDRDGDGVPDGSDLCADTPPGAAVDPRGCPMDSDEDGVVDGLDRCPGTPRNARVSAIGCPNDTDADGVYDGIDDCPGTPAGIRVDNFGCPTDRDGDGVYDGIDRCDGTPLGVRVDENGCPLADNDLERELINTGRLRLSNVLFDSGSANLKRSSYQVLHEVAEMLIKRPHLKIEIGGHTDSMGADDANLRLSRARANAVLDFFLQTYYEITVEQFFVQGYGDTQPIATNDTAEGRAQNRRVEFTIMSREGDSR